MANAQAQVQELIDQGVSFESIEAYLEARRDLPSEVKNALWLLAWVETDRVERKAVVSELLAGFAHE